MAGQIAKHARMARALAVAAALGLGAASAAWAYSPKVEQACKTDYYRFCPNYPLNTPALRNCMESKSTQLSPVCITALLDAGEVDKKFLKNSK